MKKTLILVYLIFLSIGITLGNQNPIKEYKLSNGLTVWLDVDKSQSKVFGVVVVKAGGIDSPNTGIAHYFEHMMFKGTDKIGSTDYETEKVYLDSISMKYSELSKTTEKAKREEIQKEINRLSIESAKYAIPNEFSKLISRYGGSSLNAYTSFEETVYFNTFSPQYLEHWLEINSERLINPVFRLFQSELETVYEEKNMYANNPFTGAMDKALELFFKPSPYQYSVIGSTENLKNPNLDEMKAFFERYYVASNMGLIISGNFDEEKITPLIEQKFSRLKQGEPNISKPEKARQFNGKETETLKIGIPIVRAFAYAWRGVPTNHSDAAALKVMAQLFNNSNQTGFLDKLSVDGKLVMAMALSGGLKNEGVIGIVGIPKIMFQSYGAAEKLIEEQLERVKNGDFDEKLVEAIKLQNRLSRLLNIENLDSRSSEMISAFSSGMTWEEYINLNESEDNVSKEDIVRVANKYITKDVLYVRKKTGKYPNDNLQKPPFAPIIPPNKDAKSEYAKELEKIKVVHQEPRFVDFEKDVETVKLNSLTTLYTKKNEKNDVFILNINFGKGTRELPMLSPVSYFISMLGTDDKTNEEFKTQFQNKGATINFNAQSSHFSINIIGFDKDFDSLVVATADFIKNIKPDDKKKRQVLSSIRTDDNAISSSVDEMAEALKEYIIRGENSEYLTRSTVGDVSKLKGKELVDIFKDVMKVEADIHYSGTLSSEEVANILRDRINIDSITIASNNPYIREIQQYEKPQVFFLNSPKATQTIISGYTALKNEVSETKNRAAAMLFSMYFGIGMESVLFQEIREFRSFAYGTFGMIRTSPKNAKKGSAYLETYLSTQNDKAIEAMTLLDSLQKNVNLTQEDYDSSKGEYLNYVANNYPDFRKISNEIAQEKMTGWSSNYLLANLKEMENMTAEDINKFITDNLNSTSTIYLVVGDEKKIDMKALGKFGEVKKININKIYRK